MIKVVSIEDNEVFLFILKQTFAKKKNFEYEYFKNINDFLTSSNSNPDYLLLDHFFNEGNSLEVFDEISQKYPETKLLVLSSNKDESIIKRYLDKKNVIGYLYKSDYNVEKLSEFIDTNLI